MAGTEGHEFQRPQKSTYGIRQAHTIFPAGTAKTFSICSLALSSCRHGGIHAPQSPWALHVTPGGDSRPGGGDELQDSWADASVGHCSF